MKQNEKLIVYWDSSAILSAIWLDAHSEKARIALQDNAVHLISSLAMSEVCSVLFRHSREYQANKSSVQQAYQQFSNGPWQKLNMLPDWELFRTMAEKCSLRGADLWHLAMAKSIAREFPELQVLSFDRKMLEAAGGEGLATLVYPFK